MSAPTHDDAMVLIQMFRLGTEGKINKAYQFLWSDDYIQDYQEFLKKYPVGSKEHGFVGQICGWYETVAAFWQNGLIHENLIEGTLWISGIWGRVGDFALGNRERLGDPRLYENFEELAKAFPAPE